jgi:hypothetical protein
VPELRGPHSSAGRPTWTGGPGPPTAGYFSAKSDALTGNPSHTLSCLDNAEIVLLEVAPDDFPGWVTLLADPVRAKRAYWHLLLSGEAALPAVRRGLQDASADVRMYCAKVLDHLVDEESFTNLLAALDDPDPRVRWDALHAVVCDRCKESACRPDPAEVLPRAIEILGSDSSKYVRAMAAEVVGRWVHANEDGANALVEARTSDPEPSVRKKAGWYAPDGTIYRKTLPRQRRS